MFAVDMMPDPQVQKEGIKMNDTLNLVRGRQERRSKMLSALHRGYQKCGNMGLYISQSIIDPRTPSIEPINFLS